MIRQLGPILGSTSSVSQETYNMTIGGAPATIGGTQATRVGAFNNLQDARFGFESGPTYPNSPLTPTAAFMPFQAPKTPFGNAADINVGGVGDTIGYYPQADPNEGKFRSEDSTDPQGGVDVPVSPYSSWGGNASESSDVITDNSTGLAQFLNHPSFSITPNGNTCLSFHVDYKDDETVFPKVRVQHTGVTTRNYDVSFNTKTGAYSKTGSFTSLITVVVSGNTVDGWDYLIYVDETAGNSSGLFYFWPTFSTTLGGAQDNTLTGSITVPNAQIEFTDFPSGISYNGWDGATGASDVSPVNDFTDAGWTKLNINPTADTITPTVISGGTLVEYDVTTAGTNGSCWYFTVLKDSVTLAQAARRIRILSTDFAVQVQIEFATDTGAYTVVTNVGNWVIIKEDLGTHWGFKFIVASTKTTWKIRLLPANTGSVLAPLTFGLLDVDSYSNGLAYASKLYDKYGTADAVQSTTNNQPLVLRDGTLVLDGVNDYMLSDASIPESTAGFYASMVLNKRAWDSTDGFLFKGDGSVNRSWELFGQSTNGRITMSVYTSGGTKTQFWNNMDLLFDDNAFHELSVDYDATTGPILKVDNVVQTPTAAAITGVPLQTGQPLYIGSRKGSFPLDASIRAVVYNSAPIGATATSDVHNWFNDNGFLNA